MQHFYSNCTLVVSFIRTVFTRVLTSAQLLSHSVRPLALFAGLLLVCTNMWGETQTKSDDRYATGTITFDAIGTIKAQMTYWYNGVKIYSANSQNLSISEDRFTEKVTTPAYTTATAGNKWGSYSMSGLLIQQHALAVHLQGKSTLELVVNSNTLTTCSLTVCIDNIDYANSYDATTYKQTKESVTPTVTRDENTGRYHYTIQVEKECVVKFMYTSSGSGAGKLFVYESVKITPNGSTPSTDKCTVTFNTNDIGTAPDPLTDIASGSTINAPTAPTADGYTFVGWYKESSCTTPWDFSTDKVTENITLYAKWDTATKKYAFGDYVFEGNTTVGTNPSKTVTTTVTEYPAFEIDAISFGVMKIQYDAGDKLGFCGWKIKTADAQISFYVEKDSKVLLQAGTCTDNQFTITYIDATTGAETSKVVASETTGEVTAKADTKVIIKTTAKSTATLKRLRISENENTLYLSNQTKYQYYAVWCWKTGTSGSVRTMTSEDCANYVVSVPAECDNVIFLGSSSAFTDGSTTWPGNEKKMTGDLTIPTDGNNCFNGTNWGTYIPSLSVSFDMNGHGTAISDQCVAQGNTVVQPTDPTAEGYTFTGWYTNQACTEDFDFSTAVTAAMTLYAGWTEDLTSPIEIKGAWDNWKLHKLEKKAGETGSVAYITLNLSANTYQYGFQYNNTFYKIPAQDAKPMTRETADGIAWELYPNGDNQVNCQLAADYTGDYTFRVDYAEANKLKVTVTYPIVYTIQYEKGSPDEISGSENLTVQGVPTDAVQVLAGGSLTLPTAADIKIAAGSTTVYQFNGWSDGTNTYPADQTTIDNISSNLTLTALWTPVVFHIYYWDGQNEDNSLNTAISGLTPATYTYASKETLPADAAVITTAAGKTGYIFKNWKVRDWNQSTFTLKDLDYTTPYHLYGDINLYAEWEETTGCQTIAKGTYVSSGDILMTSEVGTITIENGSRNSGAIQLGDNAKAWIQIVPASGRVFLAGDKLSVTFYSSSAKKMGFKIMDEDGKITEERSVIEVPAKGTATDTYYLQEKDIRQDGSIRIYRLNSNDRFYSIEVEQCQNVETVTATVQPGGGVIDESDALANGWSKQVQSNGFIWYTKTVAKGSHITLPTATFLDNQFVGYQTPGDETVYNAGENYPLNANTTFIAQWIPLTPTGKVKVTLNINGGTFTNAADEALWTKEVAAEGYYYMVIQEGYPLSLPELTPPTGKYFEGYLDQNSDRYDAATPYNIYGNIDFTADWCSSRVRLAWECDNWEVGKTENTYVINSANRVTKDYPQLIITGTLPEGAEIKYSSSDPSVAIIRDNGEIVPYMAGETTITAMFDGEGDYCSAEASYTLIVECNESVPVIEGVGDLSGCNTTITLRVRQKAEDGTISDYPAEGYSFQWYKDDKAIDGATQTTYTVQTIGDYFVVVHDFCYAQSENTARITSTQAEPEVARLAPFQFYRPEHTYPDEQATRHLFSYKSAGTDASEYALTAVRKRAGEQAATISGTDLQTFVSVSATPDSRGHYTVTANLNSIPASLGLQAGDTLTLTLTPYDNCGSLSSTYAEQIDIRVINRPALAFIISGADQLTRDKAKFKLHGDFLTGINRADLYAQSAKGWADDDINHPLPLYTAIQEQFEVVPVNGYADFNLYNYEPFDILLLTDFVRTGIGSKGSTVVTVIDSLAKLVDYRPMFSLKAHMAKAEFPTWKTKGFIANPAKPAINPQKDMTVLCLAHNIFEGLDEYRGTAASEDDYNNKIIYTADGDIVVRITSAGGYDDKKALQGFEAVDATNFVNIAIIPSGKNNGTLITCCERQANINARLLILSVNADATSKLTPIGCQAIIKGLNYLLETDPVKVSDCSVTFNNGAGDKLWNTPANWSTGRVPLKEQNIQIAAPCIVNTPEATAATIKIIGKNTLTIQPKAALTANGQIWSIPSETDKHNTSEITDPSVITILSDASGVGALVRTAGDDATLAATVQMYSKAYFEWVDGKRKKYWQYVGIPIQEAQVPECFSGAYTYLWEEANGWTRKGDGTTLEQFNGYGLSVGNKENTQLTYTLRGNLATSVNRDIPLTINNANENYRGTNMIGNSWTAPIHIDKMLTTDFGTATATVYIYNTGRDDQGAGMVTGDANSNQPGQWIAITPGLAAQSGYTGLKVIPAMQAFDILTESETSLYLDYERVVRGGGTTDINTPMRAPQQNQSVNKRGQVSMMRLTVSDSQTHTDLYLMQDAAFTTEFDNGWDATYMACDGRSASLYAITSIGEMAVAAIPEIEGINLGFAPGKETEYTFSFGYTGDMLYLNDTRERRSTLITDWNTYRFTASENDDANRFYISATPIESRVPSELVEVSDNHGLLSLSNPAHEYLTICLYDAAGRLCTTTATSDAMTDITLPATQGVYLLRISGENTHIVRKLTR